MNAKGIWRNTRTIVTTLTLAVFGLLSIVTAAPPAGRFVASGGTVTDTVTGLVWQQTVEGTRTQSAAASYCGALLLNGSGWRLPTAAELQSIVDEQRMNPAIDPTAFPATPSEEFWTSSHVEGFVGNSWYVDFRDGNAGPQGSSTSYRVRCVR